MRVITLTACVWLLAAAPASAGTVKITESESCDRICVKVKGVTFTAAPGEANSTAITVGSGSITVVDTAAPVLAGDGCVAVDAHTARCDVASASLSVTLGDGNDVATIDAGISRLVQTLGGPGDDRITGTGRLSGGPGADELRALGPGTAFSDDDGDVPTADRYIGDGRGSSLTYEGRRTPVTVDLRGGTTQGEGDVISGIDTVTGGSGDDVLIGTAAADTLDGGPGSDRLRGLGGNDSLDGRRRLRPGGSKCPRRRPRQRRALRLALPLRVRHRRRRGAHGASHARFVRGDCERIGLPIDFGETRVRLRPSARTFMVVTSCDCDEATYVAMAGRRVVARDATRNGNGRVALRLNAVGRRLLAARGRLRIAVRVRERYTRERTRGRSRPNFNAGSAGAWPGTRARRSRPSAGRRPRAPS